MVVGPVEPLQPPRLFRETTKYFEVSIVLPSPMISSHQPGFFSIFYASCMMTAREGVTD